MPDLTEDQLRELDELEKQATPGPWHLVEDYGLVVVDDDEGAVVPNDGEQGTANWEAVVAMRNALPELLRGYREYLRLRAVADAAVRLLGMIDPEDFEE